MPSCLMYICKRVGVTSGYVHLSKLRMAARGVSGLLILIQKYPFHFVLISGLYTLLRFITLLNFMHEHSNRTQWEHATVHCSNRMFVNKLIQCIAGKFQGLNF